ncbi:MAG: hypothetical protein HOV96_20140 [Nonomuraea sp.]|nr:hypothetical protein [Nonomuraea sp.]NUS05601.1 hypothetical protein [Nonomuraea sp.]
MIAAATAARIKVPVVAGMTAFSTVKAPILAAMTASSTNALMVAGMPASSMVKVVAGMAASCAVGSVVVAGVTVSFRDGRLGESARGQVPERARMPKGEPVRDVGLRVVELGSG